MIGVRKTRSTMTTSTPPLATVSHDEPITMLDDLRNSLQNSAEFINIYNRCYEIAAFRSSLIEVLCSMLVSSVNVDKNILRFVLDCFITNPTNLFCDLDGMKLKRDLLPFIKHMLTTKEDNDELLILTLKFLNVFLDNYANLLNAILTEWLSCVLHFVVTHISSASYSIYGDLVIDLLTKIVKNYTPLPKEIIDVLGRSPSSIISTAFLAQLKEWVKYVDDTKLALFAIHLWEPLAALLSRLLTRGHTKGNEMLAVMQDAFIVANYAIRSAAFSAWASFMSHIYRSDLCLHHDDTHQQQLYNRLLKLFLTPFLPDYTSKSKLASISKCRAWSILVTAYPTHIDDVLLPFLSFAFGYHLSNKSIISTTAWWPECRRIGEQCMHDLLIDKINGEYIVKTAAEQILNYVFDTITDELLEYTVDEEKAVGLASWNAYLNHLTHLFISSKTIPDDQRSTINTLLLTRMEQLWIDSRMPTRFLLKLFDTFEQTCFPLAIETVLRDSSVRTKALSATQTSRSQDKCPLSDSTLSTRTTLADRYLYLMLEHAARFNNSDDRDETIDEKYIQVLSYLIDTLSKTSDDNFCYQTSSLLLKCSTELSQQPSKIPTLFWHIWLQCSTNLSSMLNRTRTIESTNHQYDTTIELLLSPLSFGDSSHVDFSATLLWTQLFKALSRLILLDGKQLIQVYAELFRDTSVFQQTIANQRYQRLFGFILSIVKCLLKTFIDIDLSTVPKRFSSSIVLFYTQLSIVIDSIVQRLLSNDENHNQWFDICFCLLRSHKISGDEQSKSIVFTYVRDLVVDLFSICKTCSQLEIILTNLKQLHTFLITYEQLSTAISTLGSSPVSLSRQPSDNVLLTKIISTLNSVFESPNSSTLLQLIYPLLIHAFQHQKAIIRNKTRKCWNETFGRLTFIVYPNELRTCLRDLKDKEHLLLPCFLGDHENSNTDGSGVLPPSSTDESQLSQQIDIAIPLVNSQNLSHERVHSSSLSTQHTDRAIDSKFTSTINNIDHESQSDPPVVISKRATHTNICLTEKQKEKLRTRQIIPLLCDDNSNTQSSSCTMDTPTIESMMTQYRFPNDSADNKSLTNGNSIVLFNQSTTNKSVQEIEPLSTNITNENSPTNNNEDDIPEESAIAKKLRRSNRPSTSARKSLTDHSKKKRTLPSSIEILTAVPSVNIDAASNLECTKTRPLKSILKRLSPTKPRQDHTRRVAFHDQVKVLLFASPLRRNASNQDRQNKKSPNSDEIKFVSSITTRRSSATNHDNNTTTSSISVISTNEKKFESSLKSNQIKVSPRPKSTEPIYPSLADCDKPLDSLVHLVYGGVCPANAINYFRSIKLNTVGDIARSTAEQIDVYPIPAPKLDNIQKALSLYHERLINSPSLSPIIGANGEQLTPIASTSEEPIAITDGTFTKEVSSLPTATAVVTDPHHQLYDVDTLIDSLDYERLYLNDIDDEIAPASTSQIDFTRTRRQIALANRDEEISPQKRRLSLMNKDDDDDENENDQLNENLSQKKQAFVNQTLGERLQKAADTFKANGQLPFDDDYIELVRQLFNNPSLTHLEQLHLKSLFLDT